MGEFDKAIRIIMSEPPEARYPAYYVHLLEEAASDKVAINGPDKEKVGNLLCHIYSIQSPHLDAIGVIAKKYYCEELWKELFGKASELPDWLLGLNDGFEACDIKETPFGGNDHGKNN